MIVLEQLGVHLPQGYLFENVNLQINRGDKVGLVGKNGAGKSTLLRLVAGINTPSEGKIHKPKSCKIGFLTQDIKIDSQLSVFEYLNQSNPELTHLRSELDRVNNELVQREDYESRAYFDLLDLLNDLNHSFNLHDGYSWEEKIATTLKGLGFSDEELNQRLNTFSGGWKMRAELAKILVNQPDIILLDEPTNHLDIISISWLENYLQKFEGAVVLISHDRLFLDNVTKRTLEISMGKIFDFPYAYSKYKALREDELERLEGAKKQQDKAIKHTEELINKFRAKKNKAAFAQSLIKKLEKTERIEIERDYISGMKIAFPLSVQPGKWVMEMDDVGKSYGTKNLFKHINITIGRGEKIALLGPNGVGKSTLLKRMLGRLDGEGSIKLGHNVQISYFAQDQAESLDPTKTIYETVDEVAIGEIRRELRSVLGAFLFTGDEVNKKVGVLSGGERTRLAMCQLLLSPSNFLILDEPTNHLDMQSKEVLKEALKQYEGTFLVVSHDREFLEDLTNRIWDIENQRLKIHHFGVKEFLIRKMSVSSAQQSASVTKESIEPSSGSTEKQISSDNKEFKKQKTQLINRLKNIETTIEDLEKAIKKMDELMATVDYSDSERSSELLTVYQAKKDELENYMSQWEEASEKLMQME